MSLETVLVAVGDGGEERKESIGQTAIDVAGPAGATVRLAHVFSKEEYDTHREQLDFDRDAEVTPDVVAKRQVDVRNLGDRLSAAGVEFSWHGAVGDVAEEIVSLAEELDADLLVLGGRKRSPTGKAVFGSTAQEIMLNAPCPVTFVRGD